MMWLRVMLLTARPRSEADLRRIAALASADGAAVDDEGAPEGFVSIGFSDDIYETTVDAIDAPRGAVWDVRTGVWMDDGAECPETLAWLVALGVRALLARADIDAHRYVVGWTGDSVFDAARGALWDKLIEK